MTFSQRMGIEPIREEIQIESLDVETRNALWNLISPFLKDSARVDHVFVYKDVWTLLYQMASDTVPRMGGRYEYDLTDADRFYKFIRTKVVEGTWYECLDLVEFLVSSPTRTKWEQMSYECMFHQYRYHVPKASEFNAIFESYLVGYRFINGELTPITNEGEVRSVEKATGDAVPSVREQLSKALVFLSDRRHPDFAKSVQCSISAVEAQCNVLLKGKSASLGVALKELENRGVKIHPALKGAFDKLYGFTSQADGIRHAGINASDVDLSLAKFMLVACSAFVNYLIEKGIA